MLSNGHLPHSTFDLTDELSLGLEHVENLLDLAIESDDQSQRFTLHTCMQQHIGQLRTLLRSHMDAEGGAR